MAHPNEDLARRGYAAFGAGDVDTLRTLIAPDCVWHVPGRSPLAGDYRGLEEILGFFAKSGELTGGTLRLEIHDILANDDHVVVLSESSAERDGHRLEGRSSDVYHIRDGKVAEHWTCPVDALAWDEFWS